MYARQAIETRFLGPTTARGSRVSARCDAGRIVVPWDHALNPVENHAAAARALAVKLGWLGTPHALDAHIGATSAGYVVVFVDPGPGGTSIWQEGDTEP